MILHVDSTGTHPIIHHLFLLIIDFHSSKSTEQFSMVVTPLVNLGKFGRSTTAVGVDHLALMSEHRPLHVPGDVTSLGKFERFKGRIVARLAGRVTDPIIALHLDKVIACRRSTAILVSLIVGAGYALLNETRHDLLLFAGKSLQIVHHKRFINLKRSPAGQLLHNIANGSTTLTDVIVINGN